MLKYASSANDFVKQMDQAGSNMISEEIRKQSLVLFPYLNKTYNISY